ncbi:hypothetical protein NHG23_03865 [Aerococcaceae bacterium NML190073]|nr:hypothetical protein [Aerococcaceae bacterium NML190073]
MKKWHYVLLLILLIGGIAYGVNHFIKQHFKENLIYYTHHLPHAEDSYPMVALLLDYRVDTKFSMWDFDKTHDYSAFRDGIADMYTIFRESQVDGVKISNTGYRGDSFEKKAYLIYRQGKIAYLNSRARTIDISFEETLTESDKKELKTDLEQFFAPLIAQAEEPEINLQWLFNFYYAERFR